MAKVLFVHGMRMQKQVPDRLRSEWNGHLARLLARTPWGKAHPDEVANWSNADLAFWGDLFAWPNDAPPVEDKKGVFDFAALRNGFYNLPRASVRAVDAAAIFTEHEGRPGNQLAAAFDGWVAQTAVYMHNGPVFRGDPEVFRKNPEVFGLDPDALVEEVPPGRGAYFEVQARIERFLKDDTQIVIAHSLGSVVAYEALCRLKHNVHTFVTIGSPLATPELILRPLKERLARTLRRDPASPMPWPNVWDWVNFYALADVWIVPVPRLAPVVDRRIRDVELPHGTLFDPHGTHLLSAYLQNDEIGVAIANAIEAISVEEAEDARTAG